MNAAKPIDIIDMARQEPKRTLVGRGHLRSRLLPKTYFLDYAHREYLRALRSDSEHYVLILYLDPATESAPVDLYSLSKILHVLLRETDVLGWHAENAISVLLTDADEYAAQECVRRILSRTANIALRCEVYKYPDVASSMSPVQDGVSVHPAFAVDADTVHSSRAPRVLKRAFDIFGSIAGILLLSPVMLTAALAIKATSPGPIIFRQIRVGRSGVPFVFFKFRSMRVGASDDSHRKYVQGLIKGDSAVVNHGDAQQPFYKIKADPRITPIGRFLRKSSIDELPQLFNVLLGDMSLVGPRPPIPYEVQAYRSWHLRRILEVKPGITGLWQVEGRSSVSFDDMVRLDVQYARHWSILLDLKILLKTLKVVFQCRGAA